MLFVISPAKTLDFTPADPAVEATAPAMRKDTAALAAVARKLKALDLKRLMDISDALAELNVARFKSFDVKSSGERENEVQAAFAFAGDVYDGLNARTLDEAGLAWAQNHLRILSGLYGLLRPLDRIQPYRLEMGVRLKTDRGATLYDFWGDKISKALHAEAKTHADKTLINLASQEYFGAVDARVLKLPVIQCSFKEVKDGETRLISFYAKRARGMMARYAIDHRIDRPEGLKGFDVDGYSFQAPLSSATEWVFTRPQPDPVGVARTRIED
jgi:cytoplasmic iron level regulating protein YaaA (DUF328/UPF0246 family)